MYSAAAEADGQQQDGANPENAPRPHGRILHIPGGSPPRFSHTNAAGGRVVETAGSQGSIHATKKRPLSGESGHAG